jgi:hypothetical protein
VDIHVVHLLDRSAVELQANTSFDRFSLGFAVPNTPSARVACALRWKVPPRAPCDIIKARWFETLEMAVSLISCKFPAELCCPFSRLTRHIVAVVPFSVCAGAQERIWIYHARTHAKRR